MTYQEFSTILTHIKTVLNSQPLYPMSNDPHDLSVPTPIYFLTLAPLSSLSKLTLTHISESVTSLLATTENASRFLAL